MDKVAMYKEAIYKSAGVVSGLGGALAGSIGLGYAGNRAGRFAANKVHPASPEIKALKEEAEKEQKRLEAYQNRADSYVDSLQYNPEEHGGMTVEEYENMMSRDIRDRALNKTANFKSKIIEGAKRNARHAGIGAAVVGLPVAGLSAHEGYVGQKAENTDSSVIRDRLNRYKEDLGKIEKGDVSISGHTGEAASIFGLRGRGHRFNYGAANTNPNVSTLACEGQGYYGAELDRLLEQEGIDRKKMQIDQYMKALEGVNRDMTDNYMDDDELPDDYDIKKHL